MVRFIALASCCLLFTVSIAWAHPGHGSTDTIRFAHYLLEPQHAATIAFLSVLTISSFLVWRGQRRKAAAFADQTASS